MALLLRQKQRVDQDQVQAANQVVIVVPIKTISHRHARDVHSVEDQDLQTICPMYLIR